MVTKICLGDCVGDIYHRAKFYPNRFRGLVSRPSAQNDSAIFFWGGGVLEKGYRRDARTDFDAKYVKRRGSAQRSAFWGVAKLISKV